MSIMDYFNTMEMKPVKANALDGRYHDDRLRNDGTPVTVTYKPKHLDGKLGSQVNVVTPEKTPTCGQQFKEHLRNTSLHGFRYLVEPTPFVLRRVLWGLILTVVSGFFIYSIASSISFYFTYPVTTHIHLRHNTSLRFPAVTLCSKNLCRISSLYRQGFGALLDPQQASRSRLRYAYSKDLREFFQTCAQQKDKLILSCTFKGKKCGPEDFQVTYTDLGVCYTFNGAKDGEPESNLIKEPGPGRGLSLFLNTEGEQWTQSWYGDEGFQVVVHQSTDYPQPQTNGLSISPATSTNIGIHTSQLNNLPPPFGNCGVKKLKLFTSYSHSNCIQECLLSYILDKCNCTLVYSLRSQGSESLLKMPICNVRTYEKCAKAARDAFYKTYIRACSCPSSCCLTEYQTTLSQSRLSNQYVERLIRRKEALPKKLADEYAAAKLSQYHHEYRILESDKFQSVIGAYRNATTETSPKLAASVEDIVQILRSFANGQNGRNQFYEFVKRYLDEYNEKYHSKIFSALSSAKYLIPKYLDVVTALSYAKDASNYTSNSMSPERVKTVIQTKVDDFRVHYEHTMLSLDKIESLYVQGQLRDFSRFQKKNRFDFKTGLTALYNNVSALATTTDADFEKFYAVAEHFTDVVMPQGKKAYEYYGGKLRNMADNMNKYRRGLVETIRELAAGPKHWMYLDGSRFSTTPENSYIYGAEQKWTNLREEYFRNPGNMTMRRKIIKAVHDDLWNFTDFMTGLSRDIQRMENLTKTSLDLLQDIYVEITEAEMLHSDTLAGYQIWNMTSTYVDMTTRWKLFANNRDLFRSVFMDIMTRVRERLLPVRERRTYYKSGKYDELIATVRTMELNMTDSLNYLKDYMTYFINSVNIEKVLQERIYRENFSQLNIYFQDTSYKVVMQVASYSLQKLLSDVGLYLAIFLGGSIIIIMEIIDFILHTLAKKMCVGEKAT